MSYSTQVAMYALLLLSLGASSAMAQPQSSDGGRYNAAPNPPQTTGAMPPSGFNYNMVRDVIPGQPPVNDQHAASDVSPYGAFHPKETFYSPMVTNNFQAVSTSTDSIDPGFFMTQQNTNGAPRFRATAGRLESKAGVGVGGVGVGVGGRKPTAEERAIAKQSAAKEKKIVAASEKREKALRPQHDVRVAAVLAENTRQEQELLKSLKEQ